MRTLPAGRLRHRVRIEQIMVTLDSDGERSEAWGDVFGRLLPAEILPVSGREFVAAAAVQSKVTTRIRIRRRTGVVPSMRALHRGVAYGIEAVLPDAESGREYLTLLCSDGAHQG